MDRCQVRIIADMLLLSGVPPPRSAWAGHRAAAFDVT